MNRIDYDLLILKSDIDSVNDVRRVSRVLDAQPQISKWTIDLDDRDYVLRIELVDSLYVKDVQQLISPLGYSCEDLGE